MCLGHNKTNFLRLVRLARKVIYALAQSFQNLCPLPRLQRNTIGAIEPRGHKANSVAGLRSVRRSLHAIQGLSFRCWIARSVKMQWSGDSVAYFLMKSEDGFLLFSWTIIRYYQNNAVVMHNQKIPAVYTATRFKRSHFDSQLYI